MQQKILIVSSVLLLAQMVFAFNKDIESIRTAEGQFVVVGDQWINKDQIDRSEDAKNGVRGAKPAKVVLWDDGVLPIEFKREVEEYIQDMVWRACEEWASVANIRCHKGAYKRRVLTVSRAYMGNRTGCWSMLGSDYYFLSLRRRMNLGDGCDHYPTILHEVGHALGLTHEHQRMDRDEYVDIIEDNVNEGFANFGMKLNFDKQDGDIFTEYDFFSIMHYSRYAFSKNGQETIRPKERYKGIRDRMGKAKSLSEGDVISIQNLYGTKPVDGQK